MEGPVDLGVASYVPARIFTLEEAQGLVPRIAEIFRRTDPKLARLRELEDLIEDAEAYWGERTAAMPERERATYARHLQELAETKASLDADVQEIRALGCELKDLASGLVDFPAILEGHLAYLCWQRGEPRIAHWHTLEAGFAGRRPLPAGREAER